MPKTYLFDCQEYENFKAPTLQALTAYQSLRTKEENSDTLEVTDSLTLEMLGLDKEWLKDRRQDGLRALISGRRGHPTEYYPAGIVEEEYGITIEEADTIYRGMIIKYPPKKISPNTYTKPTYPAAQFKLRATGVDALRPETFSALSLLNTLNFSPIEQQVFLYEPNKMYGYMARAEILTYCTPDVHRLIYRDAYNQATKKTENRVTRYYESFNAPEHYPDPARVIQVSNTNTELNADGTPANTGKSPGYTLIAQELGIPETLFNVREALLPQEERYNGATGTEDRVEVLLGLHGNKDTVSHLKDMIDVGEILVTGTVNIGSEQRILPLFQFKASPDTLTITDVNPVASRLIKQLLDAGMKPSHVKRYLTTRNPWFAMVEPLTYAELGAEHERAALHIGLKQI
jgi:hypothetical protein